MQVFSGRTVKLPLASLQVDFNSWLATIGIEPVGDVSACGFDEGGGEGIRYILLQDAGEVVHFSKKNHPAVIGSVVSADFFKRVEALLGCRHRQELLQTVLWRAAHAKLYKYYPIAFQIQSKMKINPTSKIIPNFFQPQSSQIQDFLEPSMYTPFKPIDNVLPKSSKKSNRKNRLQKAFFLDDSQGEQQKNRTSPPKLDVEEEGIEQAGEGKEQTILSESIKLPEGIRKSNLLLQVEVEDDSSREEEKYQPIHHEIEELMSLPAARKLENLQFDSSEDSEEVEQGLQFKSTRHANKANAVKCPPLIQVSKQRLFETIKQGTVRCLLRRDKQSPSGFLEYNVYLQGSLQHILTARKEGVWQYGIYLRQQVPQQNYFQYTKIATLQSNFLGNKYTLLKDKSKSSTATICYQTNIFGLSGPRKFFVYLPKAELPFEYLSDGYESSKYRHLIEKCVSKTAKWSEKAKSYVLNFHGRASESSIKNFVVTDIEEKEQSNFVIFGKVGPEVYNLDIQSPFSLIQGTAVALTTFQRKLTCD